SWRRGERFGNDSFAKPVARKREGEGFVKWSKLSCFTKTKSLYEFLPNSMPTHGFRKA
ncbi:MAG: hypothetical protein ACJAT4_003251, partial [Granulosicoccus sp.]